MNVLGYLITIMNIQGLHERGGNLKDLSIKVSEIGSLAGELRADGNFNLEDFRKTGYSRSGNVGKYLSKRLRDYIYDGTGSPHDEAVLLTLFFSNQAAVNARPVVDEKSGMQSQYIHNTDVIDDIDPAFPFFGNLRNPVYRLKRAANAAIA